MNNISTLPSKEEGIHSLYLKNSNNNILPRYCEAAGRKEKKYYTLVSTLALKSILKVFYSIKHMLLTHFRTCQG
jgi:hypothetical protein